MPYLSWLSSVPRTAGLKVAEVDGWQTRGHGLMGELKGVMPLFDNELAKRRPPPYFAIPAESVRIPLPARARVAKAVRVPRPLTANGERH